MDFWFLVLSGVGFLGFGLGLCRFGVSVFRSWGRHHEASRWVKVLRLEPTLLGIQKPSVFIIIPYDHVSGCQNYGPFLGPNIIRHLIFKVPKKGP